MSQALLKKILLEVNASNVLMKNMIAVLTERLDVAERRAERHYFDNFHTAEKVRDLEEYLGVEYREKGVRVKNEYVKKK